MNQLSHYGAEFSEYERFPRYRLRERILARRNSYYILAGVLAVIYKGRGSDVFRSEGNAELGCRRQ